MSLLSTPFVGETTDVVLHAIAFFIMVGGIIGTLWIFWKIHEIPVHKAKKKNRFHQLELVTALTWVGFAWHWVWIVAVFIAFLDFEKAIKNLKSIWHDIENIKESVETTQEEKETKKDSDEVEVKQ